MLYFREYQTTLEFKPLRDSEIVEDHQITVCVRKRPLNKKGKISIFIVCDIQFVIPLLTCESFALIQKKKN